MAVLRAFFGTDTYGKSVEKAISDNGKCYGRVYEFNGFGKAWSKWEECEATFETKGRNVYTDEEFEYEKPVMFWGFNKMTEHSDVPKYRLPK